MIAQVAAMIEPQTPEGKAAYLKTLRERHEIWERTGVIISDEAKAIAEDRIRTDDERDDNARAADQALLASLVRRWGRDRITTWARNIAAIEGCGE